MTTPDTVSEFLTFRSDTALAKALAKACGDLGRLDAASLFAYLTDSIGLDATVSDLSWNAYMRETYEALSAEQKVKADEVAQAITGKSVVEALDVIKDKITGPRN
jgi:hypothetical protein